MTACRQTVRLAALAAFVAGAIASAAAATSQTLRRGPLDARAVHALPSGQVPHSQPALHSSRHHSLHGAARIAWIASSRGPAARHGAAAVTGGAGTQMRGQSRAQIHGAAAIDGTTLRLKRPR